MSSEGVRSAAAMQRSVIDSAFGGVVHTVHAWLCKASYLDFFLSPLIVCLWLW